MSSTPPADPMTAASIPSAVPAALPASAWRIPAERKLPKGSVLIAAQTLRREFAADSRYVVEVGISTARTEETVRQVLLMLAIGLPVAVCVAVAGGFILCVEH